MRDDFPFSKDCKMVNPMAEFKVKIPFDRVSHFELNPLAS